MNKANVGELIRNTYKLQHCHGCSLSLRAKQCTSPSSQEHAMPESVRLWRASHLALHSFLQCSALWESPLGGRTALLRCC